LNVGLVLPVRQAVRGVAEAIPVECRLMKCLEVRVFMDEVV